MIVIGQRVGANEFDRVVAAAVTVAVLVIEAMIAVY